MPEQFILDEDYAVSVGFADRYPVEDNESAVRAIEAALLGTGDNADICISNLAGVEFAIDILADGDGAIDGYRILVRRRSEPYYLASTIRGFGSGDGTLSVLRDAVEDANDLVASLHQMEAGR